MSDKVIRIHVKLNIGVDKEDVIDGLAGVVESFPLHPDEEDSEMQMIFVVDMEPDKASDIMSALMGHEDVEYVQMPSLAKN